ncbi:unnamed protein product [Mytilus edulis]|uniref:Uncharacterized protein n=1 Tax=Mytilus edulis TaxID=6550 RepID=A0A8S3S2Y1_MYTED|nr:unnamed protein product [Mytilus edulis]
MVILFPSVFGRTCSAYTGSHGEMDCKQLSTFNISQWTTCVRVEYVPIVTMGKYVCDNTTANYCNYHCMSEDHDILESTVYDDCSCSSSDGNINYNLPTQCYTPSGTECSWYNDCFHRKFDCNDTHIGDALEFATTFCNVYSKNFDFFQTMVNNGLMK